MPCFACALLMVLLGIIGERTWNHVEIKDPFIGGIMKLDESSPEVILLGDSVCVTKFKEDKDKRTLDQMLANDLGKSLLNASRLGMTLMAQKSLIELMIARNIRTKYLFLEINSLQAMRELNMQAFNEWKSHLKLIQRSMKWNERFFAYVLYLDRALNQHLSTSCLDFLSVSTLDYNINNFEKLLTDVLDLCHQLTDNIYCFITPIYHLPEGEIPYIKSQRNPNDISYSELICAKSAAICNDKQISFIDLHAMLKDKIYFPDAGYINFYSVHLNDEGRHLLSQALVNLSKDHL